MKRRRKAQKNLKRTKKSKLMSLSNLKRLIMAKRLMIFTLSYLLLLIKSSQSWKNSISMSKQKLIFLRWQLYLLKSLSATLNFLNKLLKLILQLKNLSLDMKIKKQPQSFQSICKSFIILIYFRHLYIFEWSALK